MVKFAPLNIATLQAETTLAGETRSTKVPQRASDTAASSSSAQPLSQLQPLGQLELHISQLHHGEAPSIDDHGDVLLASGSAADDFAPDFGDDPSDSGLDEKPDEGQRVDDEPTGAGLAAPAAARGEPTLDVPMDDIDDKDDKAVVGRLRREGLPSHVLVQRKGDLFQYLHPDVREVEECLSVVFLLRAAKVTEVSQDNDAILGSKERKEVVQQYFKYWLDQQDARKLCELRDRIGTQDGDTRTLVRNFRTFVFSRFGGLAWLHWYVAIGDVPPELVLMANLHIQRVIRDEAGREPASSAQPEPRSSERNRAIRAGEEAPPLRGVNRKISEGKALRKQAQVLDKKIAKEMQLHREGRSQMSWAAGRLLQGEREDLLCTNKNMQLFSHVYSSIYANFEYLNTQLFIDSFII